MILYTSGTTSKPKGVVTTHANIEAQITALVEAWGWREDDRIPLFLPLHHVHGIVNVLGCALWSGAFVEAFESFDLDRILERVGQRAYTVFMAVPTIYVKLIRALESATPEERQRFAEGFASMRLMVSGSAALPASVHERWTELTGQKLLERYGMTEIGMGLSNPLHGERRPGAVGQPLPRVEVRLIGRVRRRDRGRERARRDPGPGAGGLPRVLEPARGNAGVVRRRVVPDRRHGRPWRTGYYRILGRLSVDIIKSGGHKLSALEIEDVLRQHPAIAGLRGRGPRRRHLGRDRRGGRGARGRGGAGPAPTCRRGPRERLSRDKIPRRLKVVPDFPRNAMGKVVKPAVRSRLERE